MKKKVWVKPEMTILVRNKPEEAVLSACKFKSIGGPSLMNCKNNASGPCSVYYKS